MKKRDIMSELQKARKEFACSNCNRKRNWNVVVQYRMKLRRWIMSSHKISVILIDVDNTLIDFHKCSVESTRRCFEETGYTYSDEKFSVFKKVNDSLWTAYEKGEITKQDIFDRRWAEILKQLDIEESGKEFEVKFRNYVIETHAEIDGAMEMLEYLSSNYYLYVASNSQYKTQKPRLENAKMLHYFRDLFVSDVIGYAKPNQDFFQGAMRRIEADLGRKIEKEEILIIGDSLSADIAGGYEFGIKTCWYDHLQEGMEHIQSKLAEEKIGHIDYVVQHLSEVTTFL